jgi:hypothetical protein
MSLDDLIEWSLTEKGKAALLAALKKQSCWLYHDSWKPNFDTIRANGLEPKDPNRGGAIDSRFKALRDAFPAMVSFAQTPNVLPIKGLDDPHLFTLALSAANFSAFLLDWSYPNMLETLRPKITNLGENAVAATVVTHIARMNGVAFGDAIPARVLLVKTLATANLTPDNWPLVTATVIDDLSLR